MSFTRRPATTGQLTRWLPKLERLEPRETPAVTYSLSQAASWSEFGPNVISNGQVRGITAPNPNGGGNVSNPAVGAVQALVAHPTNPNIMFAAGPNGGVWRTFNAQSASPTWEPIADQVASLSVSDLALDPDDPNRLLVGIGGTADGEEVDNAVVRGDLVGVLLCENALSTNPAAPPAWTALGNGIAGKNVVNVFLRAATGVAPNVMPGYMLVATDAGIFRSDDGGETFTNVVQTTTNNGVTYQTTTLSQGVYDLVENPRIRNQFYMATKPGAGFARQVWRTDDGGLSWGTVTDPQMQLNARTVNVQLGVRDASAIDNQVYVAVSNDRPPDGSAEQSTPGIGAQYGWPNHVGVLTSVVWSTNQGGDWTRMDAPRQLTDRWDLDAGDVYVDGTSVVVDTGPVPHRLQTGDLVYLRKVFDVPASSTPPTPPTELFYDPTSNLGFYNVTVISPTQFSLDGVGDPGVDIDSSKAYWNRVVGATAGENAEYLQLLASPTAQNLVYLGGDMSQFKFEDLAPGDNNSNGDPVSFTGTFWVGDRFEQPSPFGSLDFTFKAYGYQWGSLTDGNTNNRTAPGGDTRDMLFDASGNLWVATGTGIYRRSLGTGDDWTSANGNIRVGQFWSTSYDALNGVLFGAMQDTGQTEQAASGGSAWNSLTSTAARNQLLDQEYAYKSFADNSQANNPNPALRRSVRYTLGSDFTNVRRRVFDRFNNLVSNTTLNFANSFTTTVPYSGLTTTDLSLTQDKSASITLALNANNPTRAVYGLTSVYEDSDPNGETGFIVRNVTPAGMTGRVRAMSYGGRRLVNGVLTNFNQVLYVGTSSGQLFVRGEFGTTYGASRAPGTGVINDIEVDPDDWRHAFVLQGGRVYETTTAGLGAAATPTTPAIPAWVDVSANLVTTPDATTGLPTVGGLTTEARTIALYDPNPGVPNVGGTGDVVLLAGGRGGVFRRTLSACGDTTAWAEYGSGLPNTVVQDLEVVGTRLVAGTYGRGVWMVNDVSPTLNSTIYLNVDGDGADDTVRIEADPLDPNGVYLDDGLGNRQRFSFGQFDVIRVKTGGGKDTVIVDSNGPATGGTASFVNYPIEVDTGGDAGDQLVINADGATTDLRATIDGTTIGGGTTDNLFAGCGSLTYAGLGAGTLVLNTGSGNDEIVVGTATLPGSTVFNTGSGNDNYFLSGTASGSVSVNDPAGTDAVTVFVPSGQTVLVDTHQRRIATGGLTVFYTADIESIMLDGLGSGAKVDWYGTPANDSVYLMADPLNPTTWSQLLSPGNTVRFHNMTAVAVNTLGGADGLVVDSNGMAAGGSTKFVTYAVTANMGGDAGDSLEINDTDTTAATRADITPTTIGAITSVDNLFGNLGTLTYYGLGSGGAKLTTGSGNDLLVFDAATALAMLVDFGAGTDELWVSGTAGNDTVTVNNTSVQANALNVVSAAGVDQITVYGNNGFDTFTDVGSVGSDALGVYQTGPLAGLLTGFPVPARYEGLEELRVNGGGGTDSLHWVDYTSRSYGSPTAPDTGIVYRPTGPLSGELRVNSGQVTTTRFSNIAGTFQVHGDPLGDGTRDVIAVYGLSDGDLGTPTGADTITATDAGVSIANSALGGLRGVTFGYSPAGVSSFSTVYVRGGNEAGQGDTVYATTTTLTNLILDGGNPTTAPGDVIAVTTQGQASSAFVNDPALGPPHTRITDRVSGAAVGYLNFEGSSATYISPVTGGPVSSFNPPVSRLFAVASDAGVTTQVRVFNADGSPRFAFLPFGNFNGGARVAVGDVTGDGTPDIVVAAGPGAAPHVKVFDGVSGAEVQSFFAYIPSFTGGVSVAVGYFNADRYADIVIGAGPGGGPHVKVVDGRTGAELQSFFAFAPTFTGGVNVAAGDFAGDGTADIVVGAGAGGGPHVKVFDGQTSAELQSFFAFNVNLTGGVNVAAGDITGDGRADLIAGAGAGGAAHVVVFDGATGAGPIRSFFDPSTAGQSPISVTGGVRVSAADLDGDGLAEIITGRGPGTRPVAQFLRVSARSGSGVIDTLDTLLAVNAFGDTYSSGIFVGG